MKAAIHGSRVCGHLLFARTAAETALGCNTIFRPTMLGISFGSVPAISCPSDQLQSGAKGSKPDCAGDREPGVDEVGTTSIADHAIANPCSANAIERRRIETGMTYSSVRGILCAFAEQGFAIA